MEVLINLISSNLLGSTIWLGTAIAGYIFSRKWINNEYSSSGKLNLMIFHNHLLRYVRRLIFSKIFYAFKFYS